MGDGMYTINAKAVKLAIDNTPTADVVPKSEVEKIFDEIEKCLKHDYISSIGVYNGALGLRIAELKKKYIGESDVKRDTV